jgi:hypothetical protein
MNYSGKNFHFFPVIVEFCEHWLSNAADMINGQLATGQ